MTMKFSPRTDPTKPCCRPPCLYDTDSFAGSMSPRWTVVAGSWSVSSGKLRTSDVGAKIFREPQTIDDVIRGDFSIVFNAPEGAKIRFSRHADNTLAGDFNSFLVTVGSSGRLRSDVSYVSGLALTDGPEVELNVPVGVDTLLRIYMGIVFLNDVQVFNSNVNEPNGSTGLTWSSPNWMHRVSTIEIEDTSSEITFDDYEMLYSYDDPIGSPTVHPTCIKPFDCGGQYGETPPATLNVKIRDDYTNPGFPNHHWENLNNDYVLTRETDDPDIYSDCDYVLTGLNILIYDGATHGGADVRVTTLTIAYGGNGVATSGTTGANRSYDILMGNNRLKQSRWIRYNRSLAPGLPSGVHALIENPDYTPLIAGFEGGGEVGFENDNDPVEMEN